jgi:nicotinamide-nucleotide adenylyltransferase
MDNSSLFVGRFQPFHLGHLYVLKHCPTKSVIIGIGSSQYHHTLSNPFTFEERKHMIEVSVSSYFDKQFDIHAIPDIHDPPNWVAHVEKIIPTFSVVLTSDDFTSDLFKEKGYEVKSPKLYDRKNYMGKEIRKRMIRNQDWRNLVPKEVASYLIEIDAEKRLQELSKEEDSC